MLYRSLLRRLLFRLPPETAHELALHTLAKAPRLVKRLVGTRDDKPPFGRLERFGLNFSNPVGLAAGFDKDGIALPGLAALGFGFIEAGTVTFHPQPGNERPRLFRLPTDKALINRAGFNNKGAAAFAQRVAATAEHRREYVLGVSIGKSKVAGLDEAIEDYLKSFTIVFPVADYVAVNVSSPNTPGLRDLQQANQLEALLLALQQRNIELTEQNHRVKEVPLLVKISPDVSAVELEQIAAVARKTSIAGIIATNTTITREGLRSSVAEIQACGDGGLSGLPLRGRSNRMIASLYKLTAGRIPLIGVGGIFTAHDAWEKICAGASLVQLYTGFIYQGPGIVAEINKGLLEIIAREGMSSLDEAVGCRAHELATAN
ncbi:MAG TPA: quinone-dependent dihydroorotate dehydrogenase [Pyrinomonadaceae bacterium]|nr:quinone-dependent dihydroorotate dehydrogenase [Pyrinomonadaceae bacterium]